MERSFVRCGNVSLERLLFTLPRAATVMNNAAVQKVQGGAYYFVRGRNYPSRSANETHIRIELKQFQ